jgi:hypothetical protein
MPRKGTLVARLDDVNIDVARWGAPGLFGVRVDDSASIQVHAC